MQILQFGEGNFLRCFFDWMIQRINNSTGSSLSVCIIQPRGTELKPASCEINAHGGRFFTCLRGIENGVTVERTEEVTCVERVETAAAIEACACERDLRFVVSNTTEAGIEYVKGADTFPAKVARLVSARAAAGLAPLVFLPCELIERNGAMLKEYVAQYLRDANDARALAFLDECVFCDTLVDRIVAGTLPTDDGRLVVTGEPFHFWAIQPPPGFDLERELPLQRAGLNVIYTPDLTPYRTRKVRLLNCTHTTMVFLALERGFTEVAQALADAEFGTFIRELIFEEILPFVPGDATENRAFAESVLERFANPFAHHKLTSIALNTAAKWKARCLPVVCDYYAHFGRLPTRLLLGYDAFSRSLPTP